MGGSELREGIVSPEASRKGVADDGLELPGCEEGGGEDVPVGGDGVPEAGDAAGAGEVGDGKLLEDGAEDVGGGERREVGVHGGDDGVGRRRR